MLLTSLVAMSCTATLEEDIVAPDGDNYITLNFQLPGVETRGEEADNEVEAYMSHIDVVVYEYANGDYTPFHYERVDVKATPTGKATIAKTKRDFKEMGLAPWQKMTMTERVLVGRKPRTFPTMQSRH